VKAILTGFEAWGGRMNPSGIIARELDGTNIGKLRVVGIVLPENFYKLPQMIRSIIRKHDPSVVIGTGWDFISKVKVEKVGLNVMNSNFGDRVVPDNYGQKPSGEKIVDTGPTALDSTFPAEKIVERLNDKGIPAFISYHAGTHCCNTVMYSSLYALKSLGANALSGFIHIPPVDEMKLESSNRFSTMPLSREKEAISVALRECSDSLGSPGKKENKKKASARKAVTVRKPSRR
jgi:pyroglutamyl-peptidase